MTRRRPTGRESDVVSAVRQYLEWRGAVVVRVNSGATVLEYKGRKRVIRMAEAGTSDILACLPDGRFCAMECKRDAASKPTAAQLEFLERVRKAGGIAAIVRTVEDAERAIG